MIEGEEEVGSESLSWFVPRNKEKLANDVILISDTGMIANDIPIHYHRIAWFELCRGRSNGPQ